MYRRFSPQLLRFFLDRHQAKCSDGGWLLWGGKGGVLGGRLLPHRAVDASSSNAAGTGRDSCLCGRRHDSGPPQLLCVPAGGAGESTSLHRKAASARSVRGNATWNLLTFICECSIIPIKLLALASLTACCLNRTPEHLQSTESNMRVKFHFSDQTQHTREPLEIGSTLSISWQSRTRRVKERRAGDQKTTSLTITSLRRRSTSSCVVVKV